MKLVTIEWGSVKFIVPHKLSSDYCSFRQERKFKVQSGFENIGIVRRTRASDTLDQRPKANGILVAFGKEVRSHTRLFPAWAARRPRRRATKTSMLHSRSVTPAAIAGGWQSVR